MSKYDWMLIWRKKFEEQKNVVSNLMNPIPCKTSQSLTTTKKDKKFAYRPKMMKIFHKFFHTFNETNTWSLLLLSPNETESCCPKKRGRIVNKNRSVSLSFWEPPVRQRSAFRMMLKKNSSTLNTLVRRRREKMALLRLKIAPN